MGGGGGGVPDVSNVTPAAGAKAVDRASAAGVLGEGMRLPEQLIVIDFATLTGALPFMAHLSGYMTQVSSMTYSRQEVPMKSFRLQDSNGRYVTCCAHGRHAESDSIEEMCHATIFLGMRLQDLAIRRA